MLHQTAELRDLMDELEIGSGDDSFTGRPAANELTRRQATHLCLLREEFALLRSEPKFEPVDTLFHGVARAFSRGV